MNTTTPPGPGPALYCLPVFCAPSRMHYSKLRREFLEKNPICKICPMIGITDPHPAEVVHHLRGRRVHKVNVDTFFPACKWGERWVHENPEEAERIGLLGKRHHPPKPRAEGSYEHGDGI